jgi:hypothetical protein
VGPDEARSIAEDWVEVWNKRDLGRIAQHYAGDVVLSAPTVVVRWGRPDGRLRGKEEVLEHFQRGLESAPDLRFDLESVLCGPDGYAVIYRRENRNLVTNFVTDDQAVDVAVYNQFAQP